MDNDFRPYIKEYLQKEIEVLNSLDIDAINKVICAIKTAYEAGGNIYIFGNGGSSATASHFANDFNKGLSEYLEKKFNFVCLNDNVPTVMAIANDIGYEKVFEFQLVNKLKSGDLVIGLSGSGNSPNVLNAIEYANDQAGVTTIGITGYSGGKLAGMCHISLNVPVDNMQLTEDVHMIFDHLIMTVFYGVLVKNKKQE